MDRKNGVVAKGLKQEAEINVYEAVADPQGEKEKFSLSKMGEN